MRTSSQIRCGGTLTPPQLHGVLAGVGGVNVPPQRICELVRNALRTVPADESTWG